MKGKLIRKPRSPKGALSKASHRLHKGRDVRHPPKSKVKKPRPRKKPVKAVIPKEVKSKSKLNKAMEKMVQVKLYTKHSINGVNYGDPKKPTVVTVPLALAQSMVAREQRLMIEERKLMSQQAYIIKAGQGGPKKIEVPVGRLDAYLGLDQFAS